MIITVKVAFLIVFEPVTILLELMELPDLNADELVSVGLSPKPIISVIYAYTVQSAHFSLKDATWSTSETEFLFNCSPLSVISFVLFDLRIGLTSLLPASKLQLWLDLEF